MRKLALISTLALLAACSQAEDAAAPEADAAPAEDLASHTGGALVTMADGAIALNYSMPDGTSYGALMEPDYQPGTWSNEGEQTCVAPAGGEQNCFTTQDGTDGGPSSVINPDGQPGPTFITLAPEPGEGAEPPAWAGIVTPVEGDPFLSVWTADGRIYQAANPQQSSWRAVDGKRCVTSAEQAEETCSTPGPMGDDGTFQATSDTGNVVTVQFLY